MQLEDNTETNIFSANTLYRVNLQRMNSTVPLNNLHKYKLTNISVVHKVKNVIFSMSISTLRGTYRILYVSKTFWNVDVYTALHLLSNAIKPVVYVIVFYKVVQLRKTKGRGSGARPKLIQSTNVANLNGFYYVNGRIMLFNLCMIVLEW